MKFFSGAKKWHEMPFLISSITPYKFSSIVLVIAEVGVHHLSHFIFFEWKIFYHLSKAGVRAMFVHVVTEEPACLITYRVKFREHETQKKFEEKEKKKEELRQAEEEKERILEAIRQKVPYLWYFSHFLCVIAVDRIACRCQVFVSLAAF